MMRASVSTRAPSAGSSSAASIVGRPMSSVGSTAASAGPAVDLSQTPATSEFDPERLLPFPNYFSVVAALAAEPPAVLAAEPPRLISPLSFNVDDYLGRDSAAAGPTAVPPAVTTWVTKLNTWVTHLKLYLKPPAHLAAVDMESNTPGITGGTAGPASEFADVLSGFDVPTQVMNDVGAISPGLSFLGDLYSLLKALGELIKALPNSNSWDREKTPIEKLKAAVTPFTRTGDAAAQATGVAGTFGGSAAAGAAQAAPILGVLVSASVGVQAVIRALEARRHRQALNETVIPEGKAQDKVRAAKEYATVQLGKRVDRNVTGAVAATQTFAGGIATATVVAAPAGAVMFGVGGFATGVLTIEKIWNYLKKKKQGEKDKTLGLGAQRNEHATNLKNALDADDQTADSPTFYARQVVTHLGLNAEAVRLAPDGQKLIAEALKSW